MGGIVCKVWEELNVDNWRNWMYSVGGTECKASYWLEGK